MRIKAYRNICLDKTTQVFDPLLTKALFINTLQLSYVSWLEEMTIWIDPDQVVYTVLLLGEYLHYNVSPLPLPGHLPSHTNKSQPNIYYRYIYTNSLYLHLSYQ